MRQATTTPKKSARAAAPTEPTAEGVRSNSSRGAAPRQPAGNRFFLFAGLAVLAVCAAYANHFHNSFHFDDAHAVVNNVYIRSLHNIPLFLTDGRTFSSLPTNQTWRPLVSISLAIDYYLGHGLEPLWFHITTFFWFLVQLALMFALYASVLDEAASQHANRFLALFAVAWYGLHPAMAETVNYIIQRGDLYSTLGVVAGMVMYIRQPCLRKFGLYLVPVALATLAKSPAVVFGGILLVYIFLFEEDAKWSRAMAALLRAAPALIACGLLAILTIKMTPKSYVPAEMPSWTYWITQPYVILRYFRSFFLPLWLSADSDLSPFTSFWDVRALLGAAFCAGLLLAAFATMKRREYRPISFGIFWFFGALAPTSLFVLSEVENDHRMFFPFVGLVLSVAWSAFLLVLRAIAAQPERRKQILGAVQVSAAALLLACAVGTWKRNEVWRSESTLWRDVTLKSPQNGRGLMNYGLTLMGDGNAQGALQYFERAAKLTPNYYILEINLGVVESLLNHNAQSEAHFQRAILLQPSDAQPYFFYGRWLKSQQRIAEAISEEGIALQRNPAYMDARYLLLQIYADQGDWQSLSRQAQETLRIAPGDAQAQNYLARSQNVQQQISAAEQQAQIHPTPEALLNLSLMYYQQGRYQDCIATARQAIALKPDYAEAYNNIAAAYQAQQQWDPAIAAAQQALRIKPDFQLAKNNLAWSMSQKGRK
jgi:tetratricopeptide (TPR) repeat protein